MTNLRFIYKESHRVLKQTDDKLATNRKNEDMTTL